MVIASHTGSIAWDFTSNELLYNAVIRKDGTTFKQDQETGRRPHLGLIEQVILPNNIKPIEENVKLW